VKEPFGHEKKEKKKGNEHGMNHGFVLANVHNLATKKNKAGESNKGIFEI
jgi:hypothetical protein